MWDEVRRPAGFGDCRDESPLREACAGRTRSGSCVVPFPGDRRRKDRDRSLVLVGVVLIVAVQFCRCSIAGLGTAEEGLPSLATDLDAGSPEAHVAGTAAPREDSDDEPLAKRASGGDDDEPKLVDRDAPAARDAIAAPAPPAPRIEAPSNAACPDPAAARVRVFFSPARPVVGLPLRVTAIAEEELPVDGFRIVGSNAGISPASSVLIARLIPALSFTGCSGNSHRSPPP